MHAMKIVKRGLLSLVFIPLAAMAQSTLSVPSVTPVQCVGDACPSRSETNSRVPLQPGTMPNSEEQESANAAKAQAQLQYRAPADQQQATEFQKFVLSSTGQELPIYGHSLFENVPSTFAPVDRVPVPTDYVVGPGDELLLRAWGQIDLDAKVVVDRNGQIYLPKVGTINVAGLKYEQLNDYLRNTIGQLFKNFDLNVNLGQLRSIQIFVVGQARRPGTYTVSSLSTLVNALFASGGPAVDGSMRNIQLKRQKQIVTQFDIYDLLVNGDKSKDVVLQPGDVIYIPPAGHMVAIAGSVNVPAIYEVRDSTRVHDAIAMAGGLSTTADTSRATLERIDNHDSREVEEFALDNEGMARGLQDGDVLRVFSVSPRFENAVTLRGNVADPGRYPWKAGMRVCNLIPSREMLVTRAYWSQENALGRTYAGWSEGEANPPTQVQHLAEINWDYAVVQRLSTTDLTSHLLPFNLGHAIDDCGSADDLALQAGDIITILSQKDLLVPVERRTKFVSIEGEVKAAGVYRVNPGETLRDLVERAGGLTPNAYLYAADFRREATRVAQQKELDKMVDDTDMEIRSKATASVPSTPSDNPMAAQQQMIADQQLLQKMREVKATGRVVLELKPGDNSVNALPPLPLEDGDHLIIPAKPATVEVGGSVYNQNSFLFKSGRSIGDYLGQAGGGTREADRSRLYVVHADGSVVSKQAHREPWFDNFESQKVMPGDSIIMPEKIRTGSGSRSFRDWTQTVSQMGLGAAVVGTMVP